MSHRGSKNWKETLTPSQRKYLVKKYGGTFQYTMDGFSTNELDRLKNKYEHDPNFNSLGQGQSPSISDFKFDKLV